jgi:hypothetical protein
VAEFTPTADELEAYVGEFYSPDAETTLTALVQDGKLVLLRRPNTRFALTPVYLDVFQASPGMIRFVRDASGRVTEISLRQSRVYDMRFQRRR